MFLYPPKNINKKNLKLFIQEQFCMTVKFTAEEKECFRDVFQHSLRTQRRKTKSRELTLVVKMVNPYACSHFDFKVSDTS